MGASGVLQTPSHCLRQTMPYNPADHTPVPRQAIATWAIFAALLVTAFGANVGRADLRRNDDHKASHAWCGAAAAGAFSAWLREEGDHQRSICPDNSLS